MALRQGWFQGSAFALVLFAGNTINGQDVEKEATVGRSALTAAPSHSLGPSGPGWAFWETFDGDPEAPSQDLLPRSLEYVVTHRTHPGWQFTKEYNTFPADHGENCAGPAPGPGAIPQHPVVTRQDSSSADPDRSFFICKNHMMTAMGEVEAYSNTAFWPRQEFDFSQGGVLEFDVNLNDGFGQRVWWEVMIVPRDQLKFAAAPLQSAVDETYSDDRIVLGFRENVRHIRVGRGALNPDGWQVDERHFLEYDFAYWRALHPKDPALSDRRTRRTMQVILTDDRIQWGIETDDGAFDRWSVDLPDGLPFTRGLVVFKTHAYTPVIHGNIDTYTFHWDNLRFSGPVVGPYDAFEASDVVYLQRNGSRPIGDSQTVTVDLPRVDGAPALYGQINAAINGQPQVSINGGPPVPVVPYQLSDGRCGSGEWRDWTSFRLPLNPSDLQIGTNTLTFTVGPRPACAESSWWDGFSAKFLHIQMDRNN